MWIIGLTGGIATGKSTVTALLRGHGLTVLDCDEIASNVIRQIVDMPLLFETSANKLMWPRITVTCSHEAEVDRLVQRDNCTAEQAERKIAAQMPLHLKESKSQFVLDNSGSRSHCQHQVLQLAKQLQGRYKLMGMATSPMTILGLVLVILKVVNSS